MFGGREGAIGKRPLSNLLGASKRIIFGVFALIK